MIISLNEIIDAVIMTVAVGYIFSDIFKIQLYSQRRLELSIGGFDWHAFKMACIITAPAIVFHELAHKFVAIAFGMQATFHAAYFWLFLGIMLKTMKFPFIFFVPGYVSIGCARLACTIVAYQSSLIAFAGPFANFVLFAVSYSMLNFKFQKKYMIMLYFTKQINLLLFFLNLIPLPGFDGYKVFQGLIQTIF